MKIVAPGSMNNLGVRTGDPGAQELGVGGRSRRPLPLLTLAVFPRPVLPGLVHQREAGSLGSHLCGTGRVRWPGSERERETETEGEVCACWRRVGRGVRGWCKK